MRKIPTGSLRLWIQGIEDFFGDMDFKVAGTRKGITAIQMDIKVNGLSCEIIKQAFELTRKGRIQILDEVITPVIAKPRESLSPYAPKMFTMNIDTDKIRDVIGPGGKIINRIIDETGVKIDIKDDGRVYVATPDEAAGKRALGIIEAIAKEVQPGQVFLGKVTRLMTFGVFVEFAPGKEGLVHISKLDKRELPRLKMFAGSATKCSLKLLKSINKDALTYPGRMPCLMIPGKNDITGATKIPAIFIGGRFK